MNNILNNNLWEENQIIHVWEVVNRKESEFFVIENNSINFIEIIKTKELNGKILTETINFNIKPDDELNNNSLFNSKQFNYTTNDNPIPNETKFYLYSIKPIPDNNDFYFLDNNAISYDAQLNSFSQTQIFELNFQSIKSLKNYNNHQFKFDFYKDENHSISKFRGRMSLGVLNNTIISDITFFGKVKEKNGTRIYKNIKLDLYCYTSDFWVPLFCHPVKVDQNNLEIYISSINNHFLIDLAEIQKYIDKHQLFDIEKYFGSGINASKTKQVVENCLFVSRTLSSNFSNQREIYEIATRADLADQRDWFSKTYVNGNDPALYCDNEISKWNNYLLSIGENSLSRKFLALILALSSSIKSKYCWKGGLTNEHKTGLLWYVENWDIKRKSKLMSEYFNFGEQLSHFRLKTNFFNLKYWFLQNKLISLPTLPPVLEEINITNSPIDFNMNSFNFNYLGYLLIARHKDLLDFFKYPQREESTKDTTTYETEDLTDINFYNNHWKSSHHLEQRLRKETKIPDNFQIIGRAWISDTDFNPGQVIGMDYVQGSMKSFRIKGNFEYNTTSINPYINDAKNFVFESQLNFRLWLLHKKVLTWLSVHFEATKQFNHQFEILKITKIVFKSFFGKELNITINIGDNKISARSITVDLMSNYNNRITETILKF